VAISSAHAQRVLFGSIHILTGHRLFLTRRQHRGPDCAAFLDEIPEHDRGWPGALLREEDSSHTAEDSQSLADDCESEWRWLPKRSPHLNPMDQLGRHDKEVRLANPQYDSIEMQVDRFIGSLSDLPAREALRKAGVLSEHFWLKM
jgi:hypothetical protein